MRTIKNNIKKATAIFMTVMAVLFAFTLIITVPLIWINPPTTSFILQAKFSSIDKAAADIKQEWINWEEISPHMPIAVIAAEDQNFSGHFGFDFESISKAINKKGKRQRGASTITQQVVKNIYLWSGKSFVRKGIEAYLTLFVELFWSKERILEVYLNIAEFGRGVYGVEAAAQKFYHKSAHRLTLHEAALLAAVLPSPKKRSVVNPSAYVNRRAAWIERQVIQLGGKEYLDNL